MKYFDIDDLNEKYDIKLSAQMIIHCCVTFNMLVWNWTILADKDEFDIGMVREECLSELESRGFTSSKSWIAIYHCNEIKKGDIYYDITINNMYVDFYMIRILGKNKIDSFMNKYKRLNKIKAFV